MKRWLVRDGPDARAYAEVVADDSGMVYLSIQSGAVRTSDYLPAEVAEQFAFVLLRAARRARGEGRVPGDQEVPAVPGQEDDGL